MVWDYIARIRAIPRDYTGLPSADRATGRLQHLGSGGQEEWVYTDDFSTSRCVDDADMSGFRDLILDGQCLAARGFLGRDTHAELIYRFAGNLAVEPPRVQLDTEVDPLQDGVVEVSLSPDGKHWPCSAAAREAGQRLDLRPGPDSELSAVRAFWVRVRLTGKPGSSQRPPCRIDNLRITAKPQ